MRALGNGNCDIDAAWIFFRIVSLHAFCNEFTETQKKSNQLEKKKKKVLRKYILKIIIIIQN